MDFILSNSKLRAWEDLCPIEFKALYIDKIVPRVETWDQAWGNYFETLCIGGGINGAFSFEKSQHGEKMLKSVYLDRVKAQAKEFEKFKDIVCGKVLSRQEYIRTVVLSASGQRIPIEGTLDAKWELKNGKRAVIDLKLTGDTENDFGEFQWGNPDKKDMSQIVHYGLLDSIMHKVDYPLTKYWVFDKGTEMKKKLINVTPSQFAINDHIERCAKAYNEIEMAITMNDWQPKNTYENCKNCRAKCKFERVMPEEYEVIL